jgi:hypothetical protein
LISNLFCLLTTIAIGQQEQRFALLPAGEASRLAQMYPKRGPEAIEGSWQPTKEQIDTLETNIQSVTELRNFGAPHGEKIAHPEQYFRQYLGVVRGGKMRIYVNAMCDVKAEPDWRDHLEIVMDGGSCFWQAWYDPTSGKFLELSINGRA